MREYKFQAQVSLGRIGTGLAPTNSLKRALLSAAGFVALFICDQSVAQADCSPGAANDVTAICDGATTTQYGTGTETNGTITVNASASLSVVEAYAINFGSLTNVDNSGTISAAPPTNTDATAISASAGAVTFNNAGSITAIASGTGAAHGVKADQGVLGANSGGTISGTSASGNAFGVYATTDATVTANTGTISAASNGAGGAGVAYGLYAGNTADVTNSGVISGTTAGAGDAAGVYALNIDAIVTNSGTGAVTALATGSGVARGVYAGNVAIIDNAATSSITATASGGGDANGVFAFTATVTNLGVLSATGVNASGILAFGDITLNNTGHLIATASTGSSYGVFSSSGTATVTNFGFIEAASQGYAYGVSAGAANVTNSGSITAASSAGGVVYGVYGFNSAIVSNDSPTGIFASTSGSDAYGVYGGSGAAVTSNGGTISATTNGGGAAYGVAATAFGDVLVSSNAGSIVATASGSGVAYGLYGENTATVASNAGTLSATSGTGASFGVYGGVNANVTNTGTLNAMSSGGDAWAVYGGSDSNASLSFQFPGSYRADVTLDNAGSVSASTSGTGNAYGLYGGTYAILTNRATGSITATTSGSGAAYGVKSNDGATTIDNSGAITASSGTGLSYGLYLGAGATTVTNSGSITAGTAGIFAGAPITTLTNHQGGSGTSASTRALTYTGALPTNYYIYVTSATHYGQVQFTDPTGSMSFGMDAGSTLALGTYGSVLRGVAASAISGGSGTIGLHNWALSLSNPTELSWDLVVTANGLLANTTKPASNLGASFLPIFTGGTLQIDVDGNTYASNFTLDASTTNTVDLTGKTATFSGIFSDADGAAGAIAFSGGGTAILTGQKTYTGVTTIDSGTTLQIGAGGTTGKLGAGAVANNGMLIFNRSNAMTVANAISGSGTITQMGAGALSLTGKTTIAAINNQSTISTLTNARGGSGTSALSYTGALPSNYFIFVTSASQYGQLDGAAATGSMTFGVASGSTLSAGTYSNVITGLGDASISSTRTGVANGLMWKLALAAQSASTWNLEVTSGAIAPGATQSASNLAENFDVIFQGSSLQIDRAGPFTNNIALGSSTGNTINLSSNTTTFSGVISDAGNGGAIGFSGGGTAIITGANTYTGPTNIDAGTTVQVGNGGTTGSLGTGAVTTNGTLAINRSDNVTLANNISGAGGLTIAGSGVTTLSGLNTFSGGLVVNSGAALAIPSSASLGSGLLALVGSPTVPATLMVTGDTTISNALTVSGDPVFNIAPGTTTTITSPIIDGVSAGDVVVQGGGALERLPV